MLEKKNDFACLSAHRHVQTFLSFWYYAFVGVGSRNLEKTWGIRENSGKSGNQKFLRRGNFIAWVTSHGQISLFL